MSVSRWAREHDPCADYEPMDDYDRWCDNQREDEAQWRAEQVLMRDEQRRAMPYEDEVPA